MDFLNGHDRKLGYLEVEPDMVDFFDASDMFQTPLTHGFPSMEEEMGYENDWLNSFLDDPVLNDRMMTDAMQPPCIKAEHSYSITDQQGPGSPLGLSSQDMDSDYFSGTSALDLTTKSVSTSPEKFDPTTTNTDNFLSTTRNTIGINTHQHQHQPTIIVTTTASAPFLSGFPSIQIKQEPLDCLDQVHEQTVNLESIVLPPTPPGSSGSDSDGSQSPQTPSSPARQSSVYRHSATSPLGVASTKALSQPLFVNPISQSGVLILSEEEKRTLISEGYPIPNKLPLTKQEEKNLKKIRRKIKNKISAQESRRKKKEYMEALEKRVEAYNHENGDLKKKVESLENNNRSLLGQLQKLQSLVCKMPKASSTQTSTALMVLVFCFAVFMGSISPSNLNIGYSNKPAMLDFVQPPPSPVLHQQKEIGPHLITVADTSDPYATPNLKSRVLMSLEQEDYRDDSCTMPWHRAMSCPMPDQQTKTNQDDEMIYQEGTSSTDDVAPGVDLPEGVEIPPSSVSKATAPDTTVIMVVTANMENSSDSNNAADSAMMGTVLPDLSINSKDMAGQGYLHNMTSDMETVA